MLTSKAIYKHIWTLLLLSGILVSFSGCGYYLVPENFQPLEVEKQETLGESTQMEVLDDGTVTFHQNRLEVSVRAMTDEELNRQFASASINSGGPAEELPSNPFTYGNWEDPRPGRVPKRFSIFRINVKNYEYPKVKLDPQQVVVRSSNGRSYYPWGSYDVEEYFRRFPLAFNGLGYMRLNERRDIFTRGRYPDDEFCFSGQEVGGYVVFSKIHDDVEEVIVEIPALGVRYDFRSEPVETIDLSFRFKRNIRKVKNLDELVTK